jgi:tRNA(Ile)-lysidine synthase
VTTPDPSPQSAVRDFLAGLSRPAKLLVGISGGSDSTGLLLALQDALANDGEAGVELVAATIDHAIRPESAAEAKAVADLCARVGIPHTIRRWNGHKPTTGIPAAAREARYGLLMEIADQVGATAILTGHTLDDQVETVAMRAVRNGTEGKLGLAGMAGAVLLDRRRWLLRPFLQVRRSAIRDFLGTAGEGWIDDPSNLDSHYERVRTRAALAGIETVTVDEIAEAGVRRTRLSNLAADLAQHRLTISHGVLAHLRVEGLDYDAVVRDHLLGHLSALMGGREHVPSTDTTSRISAFLNSGLPGRMAAGRVIFDRRREGLYLYRENRNLVPVGIAPGETAVWDGRYRIHNGSNSEIVIGPAVPDRAQAQSLFPDAPGSVAMRAMAVMPRLEMPQTGLAHTFEMRPVLGTFERFLSQFELAIALRFVELLACDDIPPLPVKLSQRKS